ncbi:gamma-glutamyltransferase 2 [Chromohalobacter marismortui]|uniref:Gamma-glutamyltransferase 2 n=1 Tax=Chromohalobacter marismortui TaxID=42055 RepID=A0A4R7NSY8_9GAMM|nr:MULTISPECIES: gamma-glutamyltransferase family protein [Chromohalobacter]MCI0509295.1 gamma-glutamyltransferase family protein [Chromohalobacter sp.]MCI0593843.1 gamma-glutamyltransferase family protein [Chromohalobacter sp.]TDU23812.1 gamma-glutamyltransferase 2 [Chromohalobacter marismortui]
MLTPFSPATPYPSQRSATYAKHGMVAVSQPQASQIGRDILAQGGNAVDAAIATAAALTVVEPTGCGIGGDAFALVWIADDNGGTGNLHGLNASGTAPAALTPEAVAGAGFETMPLYGWTPVTVPGIPAAWAELSRRFGKLDFQTLLAPAIRLAREGFPVSPVIASLWQRAESTFREHLTDAATAGWFETFTPTGRAPRAGEWHRCEDQAQTLEAIAETRSESFYRGELAARIDAFSRATGGYLRAADLAGYQPEWVAPIAADYRGHKVWEIPPNGQGLVALMALRILEGFEVDSRDDPEVLHRQLEAMKLAFSDGQAHITQPEHMPHSVEALLGDAYTRERRALIGERALEPTPGTPQAGGTVYLATADDDGNMVSFIQSNYHGFGAGVVVPGTGIAMQNRGHNFSLDPSHANVLAPGKKTFHTIIPGFLTRGDGTPLGPFGVMGGFMQPQGHVQVVMNLVDFGLNPQAALDAPRWQWMGGKRIGIEHGYPAPLVREMAERGHDMHVDHDPRGFGRGQVIIRDPESGIYCGGTEPRTDASIAVL